MLGIRQKLSLGFAGLVLILFTIGIESVTLLTDLGESIDVILRENYRSVIACLDMKESLKHIDRSALFSLLGHSKARPNEIDQEQRRFDDALRVELNNVTLRGELEMASALKRLFGRYGEVLARVLDESDSLDVRFGRYFDELKPLYQQINQTADDIREINQRNMSDANDRARRSASSARRRMTALLATGVLLAGAFVFLIGRWILRPISRLTASAKEIRMGNLDLVVTGESNDEIGVLSMEFNAMAQSLREVRRSDQARLLHISRWTEQAFSRLPDAVAVVGPDGKIEVSTETAKRVFGLQPGSHIGDCPLDCPAILFHEAVHTGHPAFLEDKKELIQRFVSGDERYFSPEAFPIPDPDGRPNGAVVILKDVTQQRQQEELKRGIISTVSHELKTPLTSIRMAMHVLLEERIGPLTENQVELLLAAREEGERLHAIIGRLLQIGRIESGKLQMSQGPVPAAELMFEAVDTLRRAAGDRGVTLTAQPSPHSAEVLADRSLIHHVFANLISNALKYTEPGGQVTVSDRSDDGFVWFSVTDTGKGIPKRYLEKILDQFFRVPGQEPGAGVGLGLSIVSRIVDAHGGKVTVESEEGEGSVFSFSLKRADALPKEESNAL